MTGYPGLAIICFAVLLYFGWWPFVASLFVAKCLEDYWS